MSGFGIITRWNGHPDPTKVSALQSGIRVRGRDAFTTRELGEVVLANAQFATTLEAQRETQPTRHVRRNVWLTADARIDNRDDLRRILVDDVEHPLDTDADFILAAYERWGDDLARHLLGDFAFGIWDAERQQLLIARDHVGVRPVYWSVTVDGGFVASSNLRATLDASGQRHDPDLVYLADVATFAGHAYEHSPWSAVSRLPGGHCLSVASGRPVTTWRYWNPPDDHLDLSVEEAATQLRRLFTEAVRCRLRAPSTVGIELSGGFDSTTVTAVAAEVGDVDTLIAYAAKFPGLECDESRYLDAAEEHLGVQLRRLDALDVVPYDFIESCRESLDVPPLPDTQWMTPLRHLAAGEGCKVVLTGQGGDHALYGGMRAVADDLIEQRNWRAAWPLLRGAGYGRRARVRAFAGGVMRAYVSRHNAGLAAGLMSRRSNTRLAGGGESDNEFLGVQLRGIQRPAERGEAGAGRFRNARWRRRNLYTGDQSYFIELWDQWATDGGIEARHPYLDVRVIEFVGRLGENVIAADGQPRGLHRRAFRDLLPAATWERSDKAFFDQPWINAAMPTARLVCDANDKWLAELIDQDALRKHTATCSTAPLPSFNMRNWWGAVAVGLWALECQPTLAPGVRLGDEDAGNAESPPENER